MKSFSLAKPNDLLLEEFYFEKETAYASYAYAVSPKIKLQTFYIF